MGVLPSSVESRSNLIHRSEADGEAVTGDVRVIGEQDEIGAGLLAGTGADGQRVRAAREDGRRAEKRLTRLRIEQRERLAVHEQIDRFLPAAAQTAREDG